MRHIMNAQQFDPELLADIFYAASQAKGWRRDQVRLRALDRSDYERTATGRIMATLFYEPSTRTRFSFEAAMKRLGGDVISTENASEFSSTAKGERLEDTILTVAQYSDVIVLRHYTEGSAARAAEVSPVPVINAGDGAGQHPTQALLDLFTIEEECGEINGKSIALVGDLAHSRTIHSLVYMLTKYDIEHLYLVAPDWVRLKSDPLRHIEESGTPFTVSSELKEVAPLVDVLYQTRLQKERFDKEDYEAYIRHNSPQAYREEHNQQARFRVDPELLMTMKPEARILHPLPRTDELSPEVDSDPRAAYFRQAENGMYVRMALLQFVFESKVFSTIIR